MAREPRRLGIGATLIVTVIILALIAATGYVVWLSIDLANQDADQPTLQEPAVTLPTSETEATEEDTPKTNEASEESKSAGNSKKAEDLLSKINSIKGDS